jgi:hypothetical protein
MGCKVLYKNYRLGNPNLKTANTYLYAAFIGKIILFFLIYGSFYSDMQAFVGLLGLSVAINNGVAKPAVEPVAHAQASTEARLRRLLPRPAFARSN